MDYPMGFLNRLRGKSRKPAETAEGGLAIAMIALPSQEWFDPAGLATEMARIAPENPPLRHVGTDDTVLSFEMGDFDAIVGLMPAPIPWSDLEGPCATAYWWPEAAACMKRHAAHYIVTLNAKATPLGLRVQLTRLISGILGTQPCTGVYWGDGTVVHSPEGFREASAGITEESFDPMLWIDFRIEPGQRGGVRLFTTGMAPFGLMEIEAENVRAQPQEVMERVPAFATYLITHGPVVSDGETMGLSATDKVLVRHLPSIFPERGIVYQLKF